jgi:hypothetical protein
MASKRPRLPVAGFFLLGRVNTADSAQKRQGRASSAQSFGHFVNFSVHFVEEEEVFEVEAEAKWHLTHAHFPTRLLQDSPALASPSYALEHTSHATGFDRISRLITDTGSASRSKRPSLAGA